MSVANFLVSIEIYTKNNNTVFLIKDNGIGMDADQINSILNEEECERGTYHGIKAIDQRIKLHYGNGYGVSIESQVGKGTAVSIIIPQIF
jgi:two-component system sensor histidine kinase YesM